MQAQLQTTTLSAPFQIPEIQSHAEQLARFRFLAQASGFPLLEDDGSWERFLQHPPEHRRRIATAFKTYVETCSSVFEDGFSLKEDRQMLWQALKDLKLRFSKDLFDRIAEGDVIEIYNSDCLQIFRNLNFFAISSYSLSQLLHHEFAELFSRPAEPTQKLITKIGEFFQYKTRETIDPDIPEHLCEETMSLCRYKALFKQKLLSPLTNHKGEVEAILATSTVRIIDGLARP